MRALPPPLFDSVRRRGRPWPITAVCLAGALLLAGTWLLAASGSRARAFGPGYVPYLVATTGSLAAALGGLWAMRPWAFWAFPAALLLDDAVVLAMGELVPGVLVVQLGVVLLVWLHRPARSEVGRRPATFGGVPFRDARDPAGYLRSTVRIARALQRAEELHARTGARVTPTHLVVHALSGALRAVPDANVLLRLGRVQRRRDVAVSVMVVLPGREGRTDLSLVTVRDADLGTVEALAHHLGRGVQETRALRDGRLERSKRRAARVPAPLLGVAASLLGAIQYGLNLSLEPLGFPRDPFGGCAVSNVGSLGLDRGFVPLVPHTHVSLLLAIGAVTDVPVVEDGRPVPARVLELGWTFDRRAMTELEAGEVAARVRAALEA